MAFFLQLPTLNSDSVITLPTGGALIASVRLRDTWGQWTLRMTKMDDSFTTDECPLSYCPDMFGQYPGFSREYGVFSCTEEVGASAIPLENRLNTGIKAWWDLIQP
jgi:hypothetical protein